MVMGFWESPFREMDRNNLAKELNVRPWDVDRWLLLGCPTKKIRTLWEFDLDRVKSWLKIEKIQIGQKKGNVTVLSFDDDSARSQLRTKNNYTNKKIIYLKVASILYEFVTKLNFVLCTRRGD